MIGLEIDWHNPNDTKLYNLGRLLGYIITDFVIFTLSYSAQFYRRHSA